jgi:primosomal protein N'
MDKKHLKKSEPNLKKLVSKVYVLQQMIDEKILLHQKLDEQYWGKIGVVMLTPKQKFILEKVRASLKNKTPSHLIVRGCPGSGKTLLLWQFVLDNPSARIYIWIDSNNIALRNLIQEKIRQDARIGDNVQVGDEADLDSHDLSSFDLVLFDEAYLYNNEFPSYQIEFLQSLKSQSLIFFASRLDFDAAAVNSALGECHDQADHVKK